MPYTILHIETSPMGDRSFTRKMGEKTIKGLTEKHPDAKIIVRDLNAAPLAHLNSEMFGAFFTAPESRTPAQQAAAAPSDTVVKEIFEADVLVIEAPMWNFGLPSVLKAWVDHMCRAGLTFKYTATGPVPLTPAGKKAIIVSSRGGVYSEGSAQMMDHQESYLKLALGFIGITDVSVVRTEGVSMGEESVAKALATAEAQLATVVAAA